MRRVLVVLMVGGCGVDLADMQAGASGAPPDNAAVSSTAASGGAIGTGGGEGTTPWQTTCLGACERLHECLGENLCVTRLDMNCIADPEPADPMRCLLGCIANEPMMGCVDLALWWEVDAVPPPPSSFARCVAGCPGPHQDAAPAIGVGQCAIAHCAPQLDSCGPKCVEWYDSCAHQCSDFPGVYGSAAACWEECTAAFPIVDTAVFADLKACLCDLENQTFQSNLPVVDWSGTASCADVLAGQLSACAL